MLLGDSYHIFVFSLVRVGRRFRQLAGVFFTFRGRELGCVEIIIEMLLCLGNGGLWFARQDAVDDNITFAVCMVAEENIISEI